MAKIGFHDLARKIAVEEGRSVSMNIAQIKECLKWTLLFMAQMSDEEVQELLGIYRPKDVVEDPDLQNPKSSFLEPDARKTYDNETEKMG